MRKLFFFTEFYHPVQNTTGYYLTKIIHTAAQSLDVPVSVYCAVPTNNGELHISPNFKVHRVRTGKYNKNSLRQRITRYIVITLKFASHAVARVRRKDTVFAVTNPVCLMLLLAFLRKLIGFKYVLLVYDVHPENLVPASLARRDSLTYRLAVRCFNWSYRAADELIVIGRDMEEVIRQKVGNGHRITQLPNWADVDAIRPCSKAENGLIRRHGLKDKTVFLFAGNLGRVQGIENLLQAISMTRSTSAAFLFAGDGVFQPEVEKFIETHPDKTVLSLGKFPIYEQQSFLNASDVAFVSLSDSMYGLGVPSKSYFAMAAGKPLLLVAEPNSEIGRVIRENAVGWIVPPNQPEKLAEKIDEICQAGDVEQIGRRAREIVEQQFSEQAILTRYTAYFKELSSGITERSDPVQSTVDAVRPRARVSIITVSLNCRGQIERTIRSILSQEDVDIEYILIDGASTDGTLDIIRKYQDRVSRCISEPDGGIYQGMNKGLALAQGDIVAFLNAGDTYAGRYVVSQVVAALESGGLDAIYGDLAYMSTEKAAKVVRYWRAGPYVPGSFSWGWVPPHPTFFCRRTVYETYGAFDERYRIASDHDLMLRFLEEHQIAVGYLPKTMVLMQTGGAANTWSGIIRGNWEILSCLRRHGKGLAWTYCWRKPLWKLSQILSAKRTPMAVQAEEKDGQVLVASMSGGLKSEERHPRIEVISSKPRQLTSPLCPVDNDTV